MTAVGDLSQAPPEFATALSSLRRARCRSEVRLAEIPAPARLAPHAVALSADVFEPESQPRRPSHGPPSAALADPRLLEGPGELATGRFVLLYDPEGSPAWNGRFRIVTYIRAQLEAEMGNDEMLGSVAWTWMVEALEEHSAQYRDVGGTATRVLSESYGSLDGRPDTIDIELRASWTPSGPDLTAHLEAWCDMVCTFAGLPPVPAGVVPMPHLRRS